jgi:hypothetical protein
VAAKPGRKVVRAAAKRVAKAKPRVSEAKLKRVASERGTGPAGARVKPKKLRDLKRAKTKPAIGRLKKAKDKVMKTKKQSTAQQSRSKPVKRATTKTGSRKRNPGKGGKRR